MIDQTTVQRQKVKTKPVKRNKKERQKNTVQKKERQITVKTRKGSHKTA